MQFNISINFDGDLAQQDWISNLLQSFSASAGGDKGSKKGHSATISVSKDKHGGLCIKTKGAMSERQESIVTNLKHGG